MLTFARLFFVFLLTTTCFSVPFIKTSIPNQNVKPKESFNLDVSITTFGTTNEEEVIAISLSEHPSWISQEENGYEELFRYYHTLPSSGPSNSVYIDGRYAYVADSKSGVNIFNVSDKNRMSKISDFVDPVFSMKQVMKGDQDDRIFVLSYKAFFILDISDILHPKTLYKLLFDSPSVLITDGCSDMDYRSGFMFIACNGPSGVLILNISRSDPSQSSPVKNIGIKTDCSPYKISMREKYGILTCNDEPNRDFFVFQVEGTKLTFSHYESTKQTDTWDVAITNDDYIFFTNFYCKGTSEKFNLFVAHINIETLAIDVFEYQYTTPEKLPINCIFLHQDRYLYISYKNDVGEVVIRCLDVEDRQNPLDLGNIFTPNFEYVGKPTSIFLNGNYLYLSLDHHTSSEEEKEQENTIKEMSIVAFGFGGITLKGKVPEEGNICSNYPVQLIVNDVIKTGDDGYYSTKMINSVTVSFSLEVFNNCSNHGKCGLNKCNCEGHYVGTTCKNCGDHYYGDECSVTTCDGILSNITHEGNHSVCHGNVAHIMFAIVQRDIMVVFVL